MEEDIYIDNDERTIVALSTAIGKGGIGIVRLSGNKSLTIAKKIFHCDKLNFENIKARYMYLGHVNLGEVEDQSLMVYFKKPYSYTGEDIIEFQCHGGILICSKIIDKCIEYGASLAEPGEFSKRAFVNGKVSLDKAEGIIDLIDAESDSELKAGYNLTEGNLYRSITAIQKDLTDLLAEIEVNLDYPEHDIEYKTKENIKNHLVKNLSFLENLVQTEKSGQIIKDGVNVALIGRTNVGKSSLLNALLNYDRAIVTEIAGTTRDVIKETYIYKGIKFNLYDTAGLRESKDKVEQIGIQKSKNTLNFADIVLLVIDSSTQKNDDDIKNFELIKNKNKIIVFNKSDLPNKFEDSLKGIKISALTHEGIENLKEKIYSQVVDEKTMSNSLILTNKRHTILLKEAIDLLKKSLNNIDFVTLDCVALDLKEVWDKLGEITGQTASEKIIDAIFSKFCLGK